MMRGIISGRSDRPSIHPLNVHVQCLQSQCEMNLYRCIFHRIGSAWLGSAAPPNAPLTNGSSKYPINDLTESMTIMSKNEQNEWKIGNVNDADE